MKTHRIDTLRALKKDGHDLVDRLVLLKIPRDRVYWLLSRELGCSVASAHFRNIFTERELRKAISALKALEKKRIYDMEKEREKRIEAQKRRAEEALERERIEKARVEARAAFAALPWWRKILVRLSTRLGLRSPLEVLE
ncbi:MAG: hypothetical protein KGI03_01005 [Patescibacteria group bacterium]|nr:hypothetical protein [Patescibacteria group bacterium]